MELCGAEGGVSACIGSAEENAFAAELIGNDWAWLGLYQNDTSSVTSRRALLVPVAMRSEWGAKVAIAATHEHTMTGATHGFSPRATDLIYYTATTSISRPQVHHEAGGGGAGRSVYASPSFWPITTPNRPSTP